METFSRNPHRQSIPPSKLLSLPLTTSNYFPLNFLVIFPSFPLPIGIPSQIYYWCYYRFSAAFEYSVCSNEFLTVYHRLLDINIISICYEDFSNSGYSF